jgi:hypothetical protein
MSKVTLDEIKATQEKLNAMIASFESTTSVQDLFPINIGFPQLNDGEKWVGLIMSADGHKKEHLILLPGQKDEVNWQDANEWAASIGGTLPDRVESALLFNSMKDEFEEEAYWTCEEHKGNDSWAWYQGFNGGTQRIHGKDGELRARAVRRLSVI